MNLQDLPKCDVEHYNDDKDEESSIDIDADITLQNSEDMYYDTYEDLEKHCVLMKDIQLLITHCGNDTICYRICDYEVHLEISFPALLLKIIGAEAWGLSCDEPLIIRFTVDEFYLNTGNLGGDKGISVFQKGNSQTLGVFIQLKNIVQDFLNKQLNELTNEKVTKAIEESSDDKQFDEISSDLMEIGFTSLENIRLLQRITGGIKHKAVHLFLDLQVKESYFPNNEYLNCCPTKAKEIPSLGKGFLVQFYLYMEQQLLTLTSFCPICDKAHDIVMGRMMKPVTCSEELCQYSHQTLGINGDSAGAIVRDLEVADLLILLTKAAAKSGRKDVVFKPFPSSVCPSNATESPEVNTKTENYESVNEVLAHLPNVQEMFVNDDTKFTEKLNGRDKLCYPLLRWIIFSNRSYIEKIPPKMQLNFMGTKHQFLVRHSPPQEDSLFRRHKEIYGSVFAFHGSPIGNWHSIIRNGLIVATGTDLMTHGAVSGAGIYLSPKLRTSYNYSNNPARSGTYNVNTNHVVSHCFIEGQPESLKCIAICEVVNNIDHKAEDIWVCDNSECVSIRFLFVYDQSKCDTFAHLDTCTTTAAVEEQLKNLITTRW